MRHLQTMLSLLLLSCTPVIAKQHSELFESYKKAPDKLQQQKKIDGSVQKSPRRAGRLQRLGLTKFFLW